MAELFGFSTSIRRRKKFIAAKFGQEVKVSDRRLDNLSGKGMSEQKVVEVLAPMFTLLERFNLELDDLIPIETNTNDLKTLWRSAFKIFVADFELAGQDTSFLQPLIAFIEQRCTEYQAQREWCSNHRDVDEQRFFNLVAEFYRRFKGSESELSPRI